MRLLEEMTGVRSEAAADGRARTYDQGEQHDDINDGGSPADDSDMVDGAVVEAALEADTITGVDAGRDGILRFTTETVTVVETHAVVVATGTEIRWLEVPGEYEMRGDGVRSCATCDGAAFTAVGARLDQQGEGGRPGRTPDRVRAAGRAHVFSRIPLPSPSWW